MKRCKELQSHCYTLFIPWVIFDITLRKTKNLTKECLKQKKRYDSQTSLAEQPSEKYSNNIVSLPCIRILKVRKFQRKHFNFIISRFSNSYFTKTTGFIFSIMVGIENCLAVEKFSMAHLSI